jgi:4-carboxymuconolactone decarboxylase
MAITSATKANQDQLFGDRVSTFAQTDPELLTFSIPFALGGADAQVRGHVNGNLNVGNTCEPLLAVLTALVPYIGYSRTLNGLAPVTDIAAVNDIA